MTDTPLLDQVSEPADLRKLPEGKLQQFADELRAETIRAVSHTGGHLGAGLGVVELTAALHYVFDTPKDKIIWDVGHQCYPHKILTGRREQMRTLRQPGGISGFCKRDESEYDAFGAGHSSTSISAGLGMAVARDFQKRDFDVIAVIGDGAMSAGMAYEALNNAGHLGTRLIVILNDNDMSIAPPTGALSAYLSRLISSHSYHTVREIGKAVSRKMPKPMARAAKKAEQYARAMVSGGNMFEELGFYYVGPIDGHNMDHLLPVLKNVRDEKDSGPVLVHVVTKKGHGFKSEEASKEKYHATKPFDVATGVQHPAKSAPSPSYTGIFAKQLVGDAARDESIVAITAAMPSGTGLDKFQEAFPQRCFDVGIAEQHAVTFAAGLAAEGMKPFCAIYSTFLQRAYDQVIHDVCIQKLPVRFAIDRAGLVGADGPTHAGSFDVAYLTCVPNFVLMAAGDEAELVHMTHTSALFDEGPIGFRFPRGEAAGKVAMPAQAEALEIGRGRIVKEGTKVAILSFGARLPEALLAAEELDKKGLSTTVADARFAKPLDTDLLHRLLKDHQLVLTVEEGSRGGFGSICMETAAHQGWLDNRHYATLYPMFLPDEFQHHDNPHAMYDHADLNARQIADTATRLLGIADGMETSRVGHTRH